MVTTLLGFALFSLGLRSRVQEVPNRVDDLEARVTALEPPVAALVALEAWLGPCAAHNSLYVSV